jgi:predicted dehydrogenase
MSLPLPTLRWGIIGISSSLCISNKAGAGSISGSFVKDLVAPMKDVKAKHIVQAIGSSSIEKGKHFAEANLPDLPCPTIYDSYEGVYSDNDVDVVYIGTPHSMHKRNCLGAINHGKHILCEKPFTINEAEAREIIDAARIKKVYVMEGNIYSLN